MRPLRLILALLVCALTGACGPGEVVCDSPPAGAPTWDDDVHPMMREKCGLCHSKDSKFTPYEGPGRFGDPDAALAWREAVDRVERCDPEASLMYQLIQPDYPNPMPYPPVEGPLTAEEIALVGDWIAGGGNR